MNLNKLNSVNTTFPLAGAAHTSLRGAAPNVLQTRIPSKVMAT